MGSRRIGDFRRYRDLQAQIETDIMSRFAQQAALLDEAMTKVNQAIAALESRKEAVSLGEASITVGSTLAITTAGAKRFVVPFAGVRPTDLLFARPLIYLPDGYGLPQVTCRNAGQLEVRITVPTIALGTTTTVGMAITAIR